MRSYERVLHVAREIYCHFHRFLGMRLPEILAIFLQAWSAWQTDNAPRLGAAIAFYTLLSIAPLMIVVVGVAAAIFGKEAAEGQLFWQIRGLAGAEQARVIQDLLRNAYKPAAGIIATVLGLLTLAIGASSVVVEVRGMLNTIWRVPAADIGVSFSGLLSIVKERLYALMIVLGGGLFLVVSLLANTWIEAAAIYFRHLLTVPGVLLTVADFLVSFLANTCLFAMIYKLFPDVRLRWSDVAIGSSVTALLFTIGKQFIAIYAAKAGFASAYGAAASLVVLLVWVYYSAQLLILGAEFTKIYAKTFGSHLRAH
jgi:membrane protein